MNKNEKYFWSIKSIEDYLNARKDGFPKEYYSTSDEMPGSNLLHQAARTCNLELISYLIDKEGFEINKIDRLCTTPLGYIINDDTSPFSTINGGCEDSSKILEAINLLRNNYQATCHYKNGIYNEEYIEEFLLEFQDRVMDIDDFLSDDELEDYFWKINSVEDYLNARKDGFPLYYYSTSEEMPGATLLHQAARICNLELISYLIDKENFDVNELDSDNCTPLGYILNQEQLYELKDNHFGNPVSTVNGGCDDAGQIINAIRLLHKNYNADCIYLEEEFEEEFIENYITELQKWVS
jgi:hypothetical protein